MQINSLIMRKENQKKVTETLVQCGLLAAFLIILGYGRRFVPYDIEFEKLIVPLALIFVIISYKLFSILKSEGATPKIQPSQFRKTVVCGPLFCCAHSEA
jgi:hypothetical protein